ncbi:unnamed protein product [Aspergillus oryzae]|nr:unnamed protein product [Aspergillus oryzae]
MNRVRNSQLLIPPNSGPRNVEVENTPDDEVALTFVAAEAGRTAIQEVTNTIIMVPGGSSKLFCNWRFNS